MSSHGKMKKIIIDTDPGVDDAMAIMIALEAHKQGRIEVLAITLVKGNASIKDSGNIMPGHGGLLDRFDSFIMVFFIFGITI